MVLKKLKRAISFLSSVSAVIGCLVLTDKLSLIGFGAEITATSPSLKTVKVVSNSGQVVGEDKNIENYGTRHRSAFRFCSSFEDSVAFVVSQDGPIRTIKRVGSELFAWSDIDVTLMGF